MTFLPLKVVDEETLRKKSIKENSVARAASKSSASDMSNVSLEEEPQQQQPKPVVRGRQFGKRPKYAKEDTLDQRDAFADAGEVIVTLLPVNERFPWVTPAKFRPELVPEELMAPALTVSRS